MHLAERQDFPNCHTKTCDVGIFVQHLLIDTGGGKGNGASVLELCPNVEDLALWIGKNNKSHLPIIQHLPLRSFSADLSNWSANDLLVPAFSKLTHLDVIDFSEGEMWNIVNSLPKLTHLSFNCIVELAVLQRLLSQCPLLSLFIFDLSREARSTQSQEYHTINDSRLVLINSYRRNLIVKDWKESAYGRYGFWEFSERFSEARRREFLSKRVKTVDSTNTGP